VGRCLISLAAVIAAGRNCCYRFSMCTYLCVCLCFNNYLTSID